MPGEESPTLAVIGISLKGKAMALQTVNSCTGSHYALDDKDNVFICEPAAGRIASVERFFPAIAVRKTELTAPVLVRSAQTRLTAQLTQPMKC
jgi:hypothetical protein